MPPRPRENRRFANIAWGAVQQGETDPLRPAEWLVPTPSPQAFEPCVHVLSFGRYLPCAMAHADAVLELNQCLLFCPFPRKLDVAHRKYRSRPWRRPLDQIPVRAGSGRRRHSPVAPGDSAGDSACTRRPGHVGSAGRTFDRVAARGVRRDVSARIAAHRADRVDSCRYPGHHHRRVGRRRTGCCGQRMDPLCGGRRAWASVSPSRSRHCRHWCANGCRSGSRSVLLSIPAAWSSVRPSVRP